MFFLLLILLVFVSVTSVNANDLNENNNYDDSNLSNGTSNINSTLFINITNNAVSDYVAPVSISNYTTKNKPTQLSQSNIIIASKYVERYVYVHKKLPNYVKISGYKFSMPEYLYLISKTIQYKSKKNNSDIIVKYDFKDPQNIRGSRIYGNMSFNEFYQNVIEVIKYMNYYKVAPNYINTSTGSIQYQNIILIFTKFLNKEEFPQTVFLDISSPNPITKVVPKYVRPGTKNPLNSKYKGGSLIQHLKPSKNCQSNSIYIKKLAKTITKGCKTKLAKAKAIYYWVRNNIEYSYYYNSKYGAKKAISKRIGNCVDQSHAIVALCRASKIPARYVHGKCKFLNGKRMGHVWTQIKVGKTWFVADASSFELNGFGVVNNWKFDSFYLHGNYNSLSF